MSVAIPVDAEGFIRREYPTRSREFKWFHGRSVAIPLEPVKVLEEWVVPIHYLVCCPQFVIG